MSGCYRKAKLAFDSFRSLGWSKIVTHNHPRTPIREPNHWYNQFRLKSSGKNASSNFSRFSISSLISSKPCFQGSGGIGIGWRLYHVDRYQVRHFKRRGPERWFDDPRKVIIVVVVGGGVFISVYYGNLETIPYTKRRHFVLLSSELEKKMGEMSFAQVKESFKGKILPSIHPVSIRVRLIAKDVIEALQRGIKHETVWSELGYASEGTGEYHEGTQDAYNALSGRVEEFPDESWRREEEVLDDKWVQQSRKKGQVHGLEPATEHLQKLDWEVIVVDEPVVNAFCLPGGKIVVFTGLLQHFRTDAEIATIIGHEVGHVIARHSAEQISRNMWFTIIQLIVLQFISMPDLVNAMSNLLLRLPFSRRDGKCRIYCMRGRLVQNMLPVAATGRLMEIEADYIGLLILASAGYDPRVAPSVYEKLAKVTGDSALRDYLSTHPSGQKRAKLLTQSKVMEEALTIYREVAAGRGVAGFLVQDSSTPLIVSAIEEENARKC